MIPKDHGEVPSWVERQEEARWERDLPWRCDPDGEIWMRDPSPRWRIREEWANADIDDRDGIMKYQLVRTRQRLSRLRHPPIYIDGRNT